MLFYNEYTNRIHSVSHVTSFKIGRRRYVKAYLKNDPVPIMTYPSMVSESLEDLIIAAIDNFNYRWMMNENHYARKFLIDDWDAMVKSLKTNFPVHVEGMENPQLLVIEGI